MNALQIDSDRDKFDTLRSYIPSRPQNHVILGKDVMTAVWEDMTRTQLPTWIRPAPPNWGTTERGKLSADQWRIICTVHLPITLIHLWYKEGGRKRELLNNFMDLVSAVRIANMRITSPDQIRTYNHYIYRYATRLKELYPAETLKPTLHAALHLAEFLAAFGPVHARSAPFYERYINFFHRMNTNKKIGRLVNAFNYTPISSVVLVGELEATFMMAAARAANLQAMLTDDANI